MTELVTIYCYYKGVKTKNKQMRAGYGKDSI